MNNTNIKFIYIVIKYSTHKIILRFEKISEIVDMGQHREDLTDHSKNVNFLAPCLPELALK